jgi:hypothetical protein
VRAAAAVFGALAAAVIAIILLFTAGENAAILGFLTLIGVTALAVAVGGIGVMRWFTRGAVTVLVAGTAVAAWQAALIIHALTGTGGAVADADPAALASAQAKVEILREPGDFRLELTEAEIEAIIQDGLPDDTPLQRVRVRIVDGVDGLPGTIHFTGTFKRGGLEARGVATASVESGAVEVRLDSVEMGLVTVPGIAAAALDELTASVAALNAAIATTEARIDSVHVGDGRIVVIGTRV